MQQSINWYSLLLTTFVSLSLGNFTFLCAEMESQTWFIITVQIFLHFRQPRHYSLLICTYCRVNWSKQKSHGWVLFSCHICNRHCYLCLNCFIYSDLGSLNSCLCYTTCTYSCFILVSTYLCDGYTRVGYKSWRSGWMHGGVKSMCAKWYNSRIMVMLMCCAVWII